MIKNINKYTYAYRKLHEARAIDQYLRKILVFNLQIAKYIYPAYNSK